MVIELTAIRGVLLLKDPGVVPLDRLTRVVVLPIAIYRIDEKSASRRSIVPHPHLPDAQTGYKKEQANGRGQPLE